MAIQIPDAGTGNGATGDNEFVLWTKVINNFSDQTHAASRLIGGEAQQLALNERVYAVVNGQLPIKDGSSINCNTYLTGTKYSVVSTTTPNAPPISMTLGSNFWVVETFSSVYVASATDRIQMAFGRNGNVAVAFRASTGVDTWEGWNPLGKTRLTYYTTTALGANVVVDESGNLMRSTSSERYKDIIAPLELDDARYANAMALKPIVYRSTAEVDDPKHHYYSFSAEQLGAYDPAFTLWRETETVTDADGITTEQPLAERQAEGININALLAMGHAIAIKQGELIKDLQEQIDALKLKLEV